MNSDVWTRGAITIKLIGYPFRMYPVYRHRNGLVDFPIRYDDGIIATDFPVSSGVISRLDKAFDMCKKYRMTIFKILYNALEGGGKIIVPSDRTNVYYISKHGNVVGRPPLNWNLWEYEENGVWVYVARKSGTPEVLPFIISVEIPDFRKVRVS